MKFKHGMIVGFTLGFLTVCAHIARREVEQEARLEARALDIENGKYQLGWGDAARWLTIYHKDHHPDCSKCPH